MNSDFIRRSIFFLVLVFIAIAMEHRYLYLGWLRPKLTMGGEAEWWEWLVLFSPLIAVCLYIGFWIRSFFEYIVLALGSGAVHQAYVSQIVVDGRYFPPEFFRSISAEDSSILWSDGFSTAVFSIAIFLVLGILLGMIVRPAKI